MQFKIKDWTHFISYYHCFSDWALPLRINFECTSADYKEVELQILCFCFAWAKTNVGISDEVRKFFGEIHND